MSYILLHHCNLKFYQILANNRFENQQFKMQQTFCNCLCERLSQPAEIEPRLPNPFDYTEVCIIPMCVTIRYVNRTKLKRIHGRVRESECLCARVRALKDHIPSKAMCWGVSIPRTSSFCRSRTRHRRDRRLGGGALRTPRLLKQRLARRPRSVFDLITRLLRLETSTMFRIWNGRTDWSSSELWTL